MAMLPMLERRSACSSSLERVGQVALDPARPTPPGWSRSCPRPAGWARPAARGSPPTGSGARPSRHRGWPAGATCRDRSARAARPSRWWAHRRPPSPAGTRSARPAPAGDRSGPGMTRLAPTATPAWARPQALAWNMGTTGRIVSRSQAPMLSAVVDADRVQPRRAVGVDDALGVAGGAARVAHGGGPVLVQPGPLDRLGTRPAAARSRAGRPRRRRRARRPGRRPSPPRGGPSRRSAAAATAAPTSERSTKMTSSSAWLTM